MTRSVENLHIQRANLNLEVQILVYAFGVVYIPLLKPFFIVREKAQVNKLWWILVFFYGLTILLPITMLSVFILGFQEVIDMYKEAERISKGGKAGYCGSIVFFQRSEDVEQENEWLGFIRTIQQENKSLKDSIYTKVEQEVKTVREMINQEIKQVNSKVDEVREEILSKMDTKMQEILDAIKIDKQ